MNTEGQARQDVLQLLEEETERAQRAFREERRWLDAIHALLARLPESPTREDLSYYMEAQALFVTFLEGYVTMAKGLMERIRQSPDPEPSDEIEKNYRSWVDLEKAARQMGERADGIWLTRFWLPMKHARLETGQAVADHMAEMRERRSRSAETRRRKLREIWPGIHTKEITQNRKYDMAAEQLMDAGFKMAPKQTSRRRMVKRDLEALKLLPK